MIYLETLSDVYKRLKTEDVLSGFVVNINEKIGKFVITIIYNEYTGGFICINERISDILYKHVPSVLSYSFLKQHETDENEEFLKIDIFSEIVVNTNFSEKIKLKNKLSLKEIFNSLLELYNYSRKG